jgi:hypothetical protein
MFVRIINQLTIINSQYIPASPLQHTPFTQRLPLPTSAMPKTTVGWNAILGEMNQRVSPQQALG